MHICKTKRTVKRDDDDDVDNQIREKRAPSSPVVRNMQVLVRSFIDASARARQNEQKLWDPPEAEAASKRGSPELPPKNHEKADERKPRNAHLYDSHSHTRNTCACSNVIVVDR